MALVSLRGISKRKGTTTALRDVSLHIAAGESLVVLGPSGSGKSTLLRVIAGLEAPDAGVVAFGEQTASEAGRVIVPPERRGLSFVFQDLALWPHMTVRGNIDFVLRGRSWPAARSREALQRTLETCGIAELAERRPHELSGGQQQLAALARALATEPGLVLMDEPLANLDAKLRAAMRERIAALRQRVGFACAYVTHDQEDAFALGDRIIVLREGRAEQVGDPERIYREPASRFVAEFVGKGAVVTGMRLDDGSVRTCLGRVPALGPSTNTPVDVFVRPEQLAIGGEDGVAGTVVASRYAEGRWLAQIQVAEECVSVWCECSLEPGAATRVKLTGRPRILPTSDE